VTRGNAIAVADLPPSVLHRDARRAIGTEDRDVPTLKQREGDVRAAAIREALLATGGNRREAAARLGISVRSLFYRLKEHGITDL
jgi:transcriptional regulator with PAS, ATPase and Fis domain